MPGRSGQEIRRRSKSISERRSGGSCPTRSRPGRTVCGDSRWSTYCARVPRPVEATARPRGPRGMDAAASGRYRGAALRAGVPWPIRPDARGRATASGSRAAARRLAHGKGRSGGERDRPASAGRRSDRRHARRSPWPRRLTALGVEGGVSAITETGLTAQELEPLGTLHSVPVELRGDVVELLHDLVQASGLQGSSLWWSAERPRSDGQMPRRRASALSARAISSGWRLWCSAAKRSSCSRAWR